MGLDWPGKLLQQLPGELSQRATGGTAGWLAAFGSQHETRLVQVKMPFNSSPRPSAMLSGSRMPERPRRTTSPGQIWTSSSSAARSRPAATPRMSSRTTST